MVGSTGPSAHCTFPIFLFFYCIAIFFLFANCLATKTFLENVQSGQIIMMQYTALPQQVWKQYNSIWIFALHWKSREGDVGSVFNMIESSRYFRWCCHPEHNSQWIIYKIMNFLVPGLGQLIFDLIFEFQFELEFEMRYDSNVIKHCSVKWLA